MFSEKAKSEFSDMNQRNDFFESVGKLDCPKLSVIERMLTTDIETNFAYISDSAKNGQWV